MTTRRFGPLTVIVAIGLLTARPLDADVWRPLAAWRIAEGRVAPWAPRGTTVDPSYKGREVRFETDRVVAPAPLACDGATYEWRFGSAEGLFEGNLPAPASAAARRLGLPAAPVATLRVICANAGFDFHRTVDGRLLVGLDNVVWTLQSRGRASTPQEVVQELLVDHFTHDMAFTRQSVARKRAFLSSALLAAIDRYLSAPRSADEAPEINGDPFTDSQEYPDRFSLGSAPEDPARVVVPVRFADALSSRNVDYVVIREGARWLVDDLVDARGRSLRDDLRVTGRALERDNRQPAGR